MGLPLLTKKYLLLAKVEGAYGVDAVPTAAANAILVQNLKIIPTFTVVKRDNVALPDLDKLPHLIGQESIQVTFDVELRGSGNSNGDVPPDFGVLLRGCFMGETILAGPGGSVSYNPLSDIQSQESLTIYAWQDLQCFQAVGCVGTQKKVAEVGKSALWSFDFKGKISAMIDLALPTPTYQHFKPPLVLGISFAYGGWSPPLTKLTLDFKNTVTERDDAHEAVGVMGFLVTDRAPEGQLTVEAGPLADRNIWQNIRQVNEAALAVTIGTDPGNRCTIVAPKCAKTKAGFVDNKGIAQYQIDFGLYRTAGNDSISLMFN